MADDLTVNGVLGLKGLIAQRLKQYESRPQQLEMAKAVADAISNRNHLIAEAGTGVGKSFAYLVPAILAATQRQREKDTKGGPEREEDDKGRLRIVVSTHTISLQEQLFTRDIPFLNSILPVEFSAVLVKGRGNYVSLRRLAAARERSSSLFDYDGLDQLKKVSAWAKETNDGSLASLGFKPFPNVWDEVQSDSTNCLGKNCPTHDQCHYFAARRRARNADILVVNHALFFTDLALQRHGVSLLPPYQVAIFDEAHTLESVAADHLGIEVSSGQVIYLLNKIHTDSGKGLLTAFPDQHLIDLTHRARIETDDFFSRVREWQEIHGQANGRLRTPPVVEGHLLTLLSDLAQGLGDHAKTIQDDRQKIEIVSASERCRSLAGELDTWLKQKIEEAVYWVEVTGRRRERVSLLCSPVEISKVLRDELFSQIPTAILTSATLAVGSRDFGFIRKRLGIAGGSEVRVGSPFNYKQNARLIINDNMPDPSEKPAEYETAVCERIKKYVLQTQGRAFVLFTSYRMLENCASRLSGWMLQQKFTLYSQAAGLPRTLLLERFRNDERGILFGADTFWQGVDVPGDALQNVIITKLPFSVPDHPLLEARVEKIRRDGGNPFMDYQVPEAVIRLKQGFGRLIRTKTDTGQVAILDPRVKTKRYGRLFLESLPQCLVIND